MDVRFATDEQDPDRSAVYLAEEVWCEQMDDWPGCEPVANVPPGEVVTYMQAALRGGGWPTADVPVVVFDIPDESELAGVHRVDTDSIHLNARLTHPSHVLHELAHWIDHGYDGHGPRYQANMVTLVHAALGADHAADLLASYRESDLEPDANRLPEGLS